MRGKRKIVCKPNPTKLLFKNSHKSVNTFSKTYSDVSQFCTKSLVMELKQKLPKQRYYDDQGTLKRDLSIETDICILRRYYKKNRNRLLSRGAVSVKSKYSINRTEIDTINEFTRDSSACGDSELTDNPENRRYNINLTSLVVDNLKKLLNDWIKKYLLENNHTKQKIDSVLDSILHKLDLQRNDTSSCTYTVDVELGDQSSKAGFLTRVSKNLKLKPEKGVEKLHRQKTSYSTIPLNNKYLQVISTLSIPRNQQKRNNSKSIHKIKKFRHKKILLSISKSSKYLLKSSSFDFLTLRTKSLTKRCATYPRNETEILNSPSTEFMQKSYYNNNILDSYSISDKTVSPKNIHDINVRKVNPKKIPCLFKSMYDITPAHKISYGSTNTGSKTCYSNVTEDQRISSRGLSPYSTIQQNKIIDEHEQSDQLVTIDFGKQSSEISKLDIKLQNKLDAKLKTAKIRKTKTRCRKMNLFNRKISKFRTYNNIKSKQFTYLFRKSYYKVEKQKELLNHFQSILKYLSNCERKKDIKLHIQINVCPSSGNEENTTTKSYTNLENSNIRDVNIKERDIKKTTLLNSKNIISLLDGATSESKYIASRETSTDLLKETSEKNINISNNKMDNSKIAQEISKLRVIIKSLATTAEALISNHMCNNTRVKKESNDCKNDRPGHIDLQSAIEKTLIDSTVEKHSKGNQISNNVPKSPILSGLKLRKEPKNKNVSPKRSISYNIIASESIMKVTDMTSAAQNIITCEKMMDEGLTCSLPKSKSLFEIAVGPNKRKLLAFYCDDFVKPEEYLYSLGECSDPCFSNPRRKPCHWAKPKCVYSKCFEHECCDKHTCPGEPQRTCTGYIPPCDVTDDNNSCSVCVNIDPKTCASKVTIRNRAGLGFWEGCLYCFLLWIPVIVISWLFYIYVIKDLIAPRDDTSSFVIKKVPDSSGNTLAPIFLKFSGRSPQHRPLRLSQGSLISSLSLSDLGF